MLKRTLQGGFINPAYEKWNRRAGIVAVILLLALFGVLLYAVIADATGGLPPQWELS